ncbi:hypothetical protein DPMN_070111 [Dreissena polymorpha]|uniref:Uncharacterized protein n=1 Tax=Dreissena polymorpha TaxID=45954 RepID=A0A9D3Z5E4_DREPO|nr:hypothetical protein DPMN_070111 [Dreissena polymorpha]
MSEYREPSTRMSSPADFADSQNLEGLLSGMVIYCMYIVVSLHRWKRDRRSGGGSIEDGRGRPKAQIQARIS